MFWFWFSVFVVAVLAVEGRTVVSPASSGPDKDLLTKYRWVHKDTTEDSDENSAAVDDPRCSTMTLGHFHLRAQRRSLLPISRHSTYQLPPSHTAVQYQRQHET